MQWYVPSCQADAIQKCGWASVSAWYQVPHSSFVCPCLDVSQLRGLRGLHVLVQVLEPALVVGKAMPGTKLIPNTNFSVDAFRFPGDHISGYFLTHAHGGVVLLHPRISCRMRTFHTLPQSYTTLTDNSNLISVGRRSLHRAE